NKKKPLEIINTLLNVCVHWFYWFYGCPLVAREMESTGITGSGHMCPLCFVLNQLA
ncbi:MAG: hypothetical protein ACI8Z1_002783, partial [Candidatus Azotimanducaceae bacterium]